MELCVYPIKREVHEMKYIDNMMEHRSASTKQLIPNPTETEQRIIQQRVRSIMDRV